MANLILKTCTSPNVFGECVEYLPVDGYPCKINGIFDEPFQEAMASSDDSVLSTRPKLGIRLADLDCKPGPGDKVRVRGITFSIQEDRPDGRGGSVLYLQKDDYQ